jgi:hypothetical protein
MEAACTSEMLATLPTSGRCRATRAEPTRTEDCYEIEKSGVKFVDSTGILVPCVADLNRSCPKLFSVLPPPPPPPQALNANVCPNCEPPAIGACVWSLITELPGHWSHAAAVRFSHYRLIAVQCTDRAVNLDSGLLSGLLSCREGKPHRAG